MITNVMDADIHTVLNSRMLNVVDSPIPDGVHADRRNLRIPRGDSRDDIPLAIQLNAVGRDLEVAFTGVPVRNGFLRLVQSLDFATLTAELL